MSHRVRKGLYADSGRGRWFAFMRDRQGASAVEFAFVCPVFLLLVFSILGAGLAGFYQAALDDAVRAAAKQLQIAGPASASGPGFVAAVCNQFAVLASDCTTKLSYNIQANAASALFASLAPMKMPASGALPNGFPGQPAANSNVLVQVAYPLPFTLPFVGSAITLTGTNSLLSTTTVRMEPYG